MKQRPNMAFQDIVAKAPLSSRFHYAAPSTLQATSLVTLFKSVFLATGEMASWLARVAMAPKRDCVGCRFMACADYMERRAGELAGLVTRAILAAQPAAGDDGRERTSTAVTVPEVQTALLRLPDLADGFELPNDFPKVLQCVPSNPIYTCIQRPWFLIRPS